MNESKINKKKKMKKKVEIIEYFNGYVSIEKHTVDHILYITLLLHFCPYEGIPNPPI